MMPHELTPTPFWTAEDRQEAVCTADRPATLWLRGPTGEVSHPVPAGATVVTVPSGPGVTEIECAFVEDGREPRAWERLAWRPGRRWEVLAMATGHVDVYSTATYDLTPEEHAVMLDRALDLCDRHPDFRYQIENLLPVVEYRELRPRRMDELMDRIAEGRVGVGAQATGIHHAEASSEELVQAHLGLARRLGVRPNCGYTCDVPAATVQYRQLLARSGIPRWIHSPNRFPAPDGNYGIGRLLRALPVFGRAAAPDGSVVQAWLPAVHYGHDAERFGFGPGEVDRPGAAEGDVDAMRERIAATLALIEADPAAWPFLPIGKRGVRVYPIELSSGDNHPIPASWAALAARWNERYAWPRIVFGTAAGVFDAIEASGIDLPLWEGEIGDTWAWIVANQAPLNGIVRGAVGRALAAQVSAAVSEGACPPGAATALHHAAMFESHDWWYAGDLVMGVPDLAKAEFARAARNAADEAVAQVGGEAVAQVGGEAVAHAAGVACSVPLLLPAAGSPPGAQLVPRELLGAHFAPCPSSVALEPSRDTDGGAGGDPDGDMGGDAGAQGGTGGDAGGDPVARGTGDFAVAIRDFAPYEAIALATTGEARGRERDAPEVAAAHARTCTVPAGGTGVIENEHYRIEVGTGGVTSLVDKALGRELLAAPLGRVRLTTPSLDGIGIAPGVAWESAQESMRSSFASWEECVLDSAAIWEGPVWSAARLDGAVSGSPVSVTVALYAGIARVDCTVVVGWKAEPALARLLASFELALGPVEVSRYEVPFGSVVAGTEAPVGPASLRLAGRWVSFAARAGAAVIASADCGVVLLGDPAARLADLHLLDAPGEASAHFVLSDTGAPSPLVQPGTLCARWSLTSRREPFAPNEAWRFAAGFAEQVVPVAAACPGWAITPANVVPTILKPSGDGDCVVLRLVELDGRDADVIVEPPWPVGGMDEAAPDERPIGPVALPMRMGPYEIRTLLIRRADT